MDTYTIVYHPYVTEKAMNNMEKHNALEFVVDSKATKLQIKIAIEQMFDAKVKNITTRIRKDGKHAIVTFMPDFNAEDIGMRIGVF